MVYQFNPIGQLVDVHFNVKETAAKTGFKSQSIRGSIKNKSLLLSSYFFSLDKNFRLPIQRKPIKPMITTRAEYLYLTEK